MRSSPIAKAATSPIAPRPACTTNTRPPTSRAWPNRCAWSIAERSPAFTVVAIHKFLKAGYAIDSFAAFEPDPDNFAVLASRDFNIAKRLCLPLGTWSKSCQLRFSSDGSMASRLSDAGDTVIQCVAVDDVLQGEPVNVVKLDVEGAEIETLKGMRKIIADQKPALLVSAYHLPEHLYAIIDLIESWNLGYRFHLRVHEFNTFGTVVYAYQ